MDLQDAVKTFTVIDLVKNVQTNGKEVCCERRSMLKNQVLFQSHDVWFYLPQPA